MIFMEKYVILFIIGSLLLISSSIGLLIDLSNMNSIIEDIDIKVGNLTDRISGLDDNFYQIKQNEDYYTNIRNTIIILQAINVSNSNIERLEDLSKKYLIEAINGKYFSINNKQTTKEQYKEWEGLSRRELEDLNNIYAPEFFNFYNTFTIKKNEFDKLKQKLVRERNLKQILYGTINILGLVLVFFYDIRERKEFKMHSNIH